MLTRRHIRTKVMQSLYALHCTDQIDLPTQEQFLQQSSNDTYLLFLWNLSLLRELHEFAAIYLKQKQNQYHTEASNTDQVSMKFVTNPILRLLQDSEILKAELADKEVSWELDQEYVRILWKEIQDSIVYKRYIEGSLSSYLEEHLQAFESTDNPDIDFISLLFKEVIAPNDKLYDFYEDKEISWSDDIALVNTSVLRFLRGLSKKSDEAPLLLPKVYKDSQDALFGQELLRKTLLNDKELTDRIKDRTPNWDTERITRLDALLIKMALCEFLYFSDIPVRVTINEYLEIAKEYSTPKSNIFINGVLDKVSKEYIKDGVLNKINRGFDLID